MKAGVTVQLAVPHTLGTVPAVAPAASSATFQQYLNKGIVNGREALFSVAPVSGPVKGQDNTEIRAKRKPHQLPLPL